MNGLHYIKKTLVIMKDEEYYRSPRSSPQPEIRDTNKIAQRNPASSPFLPAQAPVPGSSPLPLQALSRGLHLRRTSDPYGDIQRQVQSLHRCWF